jgi:hypothetical protein
MSVIEVIKRCFTAMLHIWKSDFNAMIALIKVAYKSICRERDKKRIQRLEDKIYERELTIMVYRDKKYAEIKKFVEKYGPKEDETNG